MLRLKSFFKVKFRSVVLGCLLYRNRLHVTPNGTPVARPKSLNPLNIELNPICHLLALLGARHILHISRIRVKWPSVLANYPKIDKWVAYTSQHSLASALTWEQEVAPFLCGL